MESQQCEVSSNLQDDPASAFKYLAPDIRRLSQPVPWRAVTAIGYDWALIIACFVVSLNIGSPFVWFLSALIISGRQHALLIIMHDASHRLLTNKSLGVLISNLFCSWPLFIETEGYRVNHIPHHRYLNTEKDPDLLRKLDRESEWDFPMEKKRLLKMFLRDLAGGGLIDNLRAMKKMGANKQQVTRDSKQVISKVGKIFYYGLVCSIITYVELWEAVLLLWLFPVFIFLPLFLRVRAIAEHFGLEGKSEIKLTRNYFGPWWERALFYPHNINYHLDHHVFATVPFYNLPKLHKLLMKNDEYAELAQENYSIFGPSESSVLHDIFNKGYSSKELVRKV